jgi:hypothetical protein
LVRPIEASPSAVKRNYQGALKLPVGDDRVDAVLVAARWNAGTASAADDPGANETDDPIIAAIEATSARIC